MINEQEANTLIKKFIELREQANFTKNPKIINEFRKHEQVCIEKFHYLITMRTNKYKNFSNYEDLIQEGQEALIKGMKTYDPKRGSVFWWLHKYIETRISRSANLHTTIRYPLKFAKANKPHRENCLPVMIETKCGPEDNVEFAQVSYAIKNAMIKLDQDQQNIISMAYGFGGDKPLSISKICKKMNMTRMNCIKTIHSALNVIRQNIEL